MSFNITSVKTSSGGAWQGDNPLQYAFPLLIIQTTLVLLISRVLACLLKPLRQPKVVAEIGGILLGPSALGRNKEFTQWIFPSWSTPILESVASMGLLFFLFLVGLELDLNAIRRSGKKAFGIAVAGISLPFIFGIGVTFLLRKAIKGSGTVGYTQYLVFIGVSLSITAFPVLARILAELKLLTTQVGQTAMAAAAFNDVAAWILLALAVALQGGGAHNSSIVSIWILLSGIGFVIFMLVVTKPVMQWVAKQCSSGGHENIVDEAYICLTLAAVMVSGFLTDLIGIHSIFGAFIFGLTIPKDGEFAASLIKRIEDFVSGLLLPLYFASSGLKTNVSKIKGLEAWGLLALVISTACTGKILGTFLVAMLCMTPVRESLTLGVLMNTKGLVELIVLNIGREKKVLDDEMFAILVLMALFTTFMTTPMALAIYRPERDISNSIQQRGLRQETTMTKTLGGEKLRIIACIRGPGDSPSLINLIESSRSNKNSTMKLYIMQLVQLTDRSSSIMMVQRARKNGFPFIRRFRKGEPNDQVMAAFEAYSQLGRVTVRPTMSISALPVMHQDICHVAKKKKVEMIILPFHKQWKRNGDEAAEVNLGQGWKGVNESILTNAPCSVAIFVDRGFGNNRGKHPSEASLVNRVCIIFLGGPDSRKSLEIGSRMAEHPAVRVTIIRFIEYAEVEGNVKEQSSIEVHIEEDGGSNIEPKNNRREKEMDEVYLLEFRKRWEGLVEYVEKVASNIGQELLALGQSNTYELILVGKGRFPPATAATLRDCRAEHADLGPAGDLLASSGQGINCSALVIQAHEDNSPDSNTVHHRL